MKLNITFINEQEVLIEAVKGFFKVNVITSADNYKEKLSACKNIKEIAMII